MNSITILAPPHPEIAIEDFCEQLEIPLEEVSNLVYLALQATTDTLLSKQLLKLTTERLDEVRRMVAAHSRPRVRRAA